MSDLFRGAGFFLQGLRLMWRPGVRPWALAPLVVSGLLYAGLLWFASEHVEAWVGSLVGALPEWLRAVEWVLLILAWAAAIGVVAFTFVLVVSVVAAPFNGPLAAATERSLTSSSPSGVPWYRSVFGIPGMVIQETRKVLYALLWSVPFLMLFLIPVVNVAAPILWFLFNAWVVALAFTDYAMDNNGLPFREMRRLLRSRLSLSMGFGSAAFLALTIPVLNLLAVPAAVCGGTALWASCFRSKRP
jgi:CysZ protein